MLFGVCGGFGEYFGVNTDVVRLIWIFTVLLGGIGILPYVAAILLMPEGDGGEARPAEGPGRYIGFALIALALLFFLQQLDLSMSSFWMFRLLGPLVLLAVGTLLVWPGLRAGLGFRSGRPVRRSVTDRVLAGVAGGIGEAMGTDPNLVRIGFVLAAVLTRGIAILVYLALIPIWKEEEIAPVGPAGSSAPPPPPPPGPPGPEGAAEPPPPASPPPAPPPPAPDPAPEPAEPSEPDPSAPPADTDPEAPPDQEKPA
jgi:phage shock protein PspC (stress-responsive transcriptional regulator)